MDSVELHSEQKGFIREKGERAEEKQMWQNNEYCRICFFYVTGKFVQESAFTLE